MTFQVTDAFVTIATVEIELLINFYTNLLGKDPQRFIPNVYAEFFLPGLRLGIFHPQETHRQEFENSAFSGMSLCFEVSDLEDVIAHLTALGYPPIGEIIVASHGREIYAYDPVGNRLILHQTVYGTGE